ncbi:aminotransferase class I/II-fold pyridoxal phosphate-dependent enzyme [Tunicatimonas pelagia]|uniref:aminotransferase class I/II-fold pyridoxal phosphate-dependent enzyme n=1 Tax=Tunicatimonas pelagia TaxID=931531 RepID=UPI002665DA86|nr:aminotransferase class I/II-fold pyridoxal phosphate-dependent enzyme [Tunicatimonas pelagia]WKN45887.1 aminotransferase class I/II-fold pyridoxal phosphate-dependent enzyme [Tunicatimonas pelagia]
MIETQALPGRTIVTEGKERLYFSGTSYLGIHKNVIFQELLRDGFSQYGTGYSSSRSSNVQLSIYEESESWLASFVGAPSVLTFSSGYLTGQALVRTLDQGQRFVYAPQAHPALWRNEKDNVPGQYSEWVSHLEAKVGYGDEEVVIVTNSVDPLYAQPHSFAWVAHLPEYLKVTLIIDDSHGLGVLGERGEGIYATVKQLTPPNVSLVVVSSLGKALGVPGGVVLGDNSTVQQLKRSTYFVAASPAIPAYLHAMLRAEKLYALLLTQLRENVQHFQSLIQNTDVFQYFGNYPVFYSSDQSLCEALSDQCVLSNFPYPNPDSDCITRVVISALHTRSDFDTLAQLVREYTTTASER